MPTKCLDRTNEKDIIMRSIQSNKITAVTSMQSSGSTTLLWHIFCTLLEKEKIAFFIDFKKDKIANQIGQQLQIYLTTNFKLRNVFREMILPKILRCIGIPHTNINADSILNIINRIEEINTFYIEDEYERLLRVCIEIIENEKPFVKQDIYFIIDNATENYENNEDLLKRIANMGNSTLLLSNTNKIQKFLNDVRDDLSIREYILPSPPEELIRLLCTEVYGLDVSHCTPLVGQDYDIYKICNDLSVAQNLDLPQVEKEICNIIALFSGKLTEKTIKSYLSYIGIDLDGNILNNLITKQAILKSEQNILFCGIKAQDPILNAEYELSVKEFLQDNLDNLSMQELVYLYDSTHTLNLQQKIALSIIRCSVISGNDEFKKYVTHIYSIDNENDLILVLCCLYRIAGFDKGLYLYDNYIKNHTETHTCKYIYALFLERKYDTAALEIIRQLLYDNELPEESKCYLAISYISCILNIGNKSDLQVFFDPTDSLYYKKFSNCKNYVNLLNALGNHCDTDELLQQAFSIFQIDSQYFYNKAIPNLIAYYDAKNNRDLGDMAISKNGSKIILETDTAFFYNNMALHNLKYGIEKIENIKRTFKILSQKNKTKAASLFSSINYGITLIYEGNIEEGIEYLAQLTEDITNNPSRPLKSNYNYNMLIIAKCFPSYFEHYNKALSDIAEGDRNYDEYRLFLQENVYDISSFKKHVKFCYLYERKFDIFSLLNIRL